MTRLIWHAQTADSIMLFHANSSTPDHRKEKTMSIPTVSRVVDALNRLKSIRLIALIASFLMVAGVAMIGASPASATGATPVHQAVAAPSTYDNSTAAAAPATSDDTISTSVTSTSVGTASFSASTETRVLVGIKGKITVAYGSPTPAHPSRCIHVKNPGQRKGHTCIILPVGFHFQNGWKQSNGTWVYLNWTVSKGDQTFYLAKDGWHKASCKNKVKLGHWSSSAPPKSHFYFVKRFSYKYHVKVTGSAAATAYAKATVTSGACAGSTATGSASARVSAYSEIWITAYSSASAQGTARGKLSASVVLKLKTAATSKLSGSAQANASAKITCHVTTPPCQPPYTGTPGNCTPPPCQYGGTYPNCHPAPEHPEVSINQKNDVDVSDTATVCANFSVPGSDSATLTFTSLYGSWPGGKTFMVTGTGTQCTTYQAPSEVPNGGKDTLTAGLRDNSTGLSDDTPNDNSTQITINANTPPPL